MRPEVRVATVNGVGCDQPRIIPELLRRDVSRIQQAEQQPGQASPRVIQRIFLDLLQELQGSIDGTCASADALPIHAFNAAGPCPRPPARIAYNPEQRRPEIRGEWTNPPCGPRHATPGMRATVSRRSRSRAADDVLYDRKRSGRGQRRKRGRRPMPNVDLPGPHAKVRQELSLIFPGELRGVSVAGHTNRIFTDQEKGELPGYEPRPMPPDRVAMAQVHTVVARHERAHPEGRDSAALHQPAEESAAKKLCDLSMNRLETAGCGHGLKSRVRSAPSNSSADYAGIRVLDFANRRVVGGRFQPDQPPIRESPSGGSRHRGGRPHSATTPPEGRDAPRVAARCAGFRSWVIDLQADSNKPRRPEIRPASIPASNSNSICSGCCRNPNRPYSCA